MHLLSIMTVLCWSAGYSMSGQIDPHAENELWAKIKDSRVQNVIQLVDGEIRPADIQKTLKVVCISDTHEQLGNVTIPDGDVLIHAGDFTNNGGQEQLELFNSQMAKQPHKHKLVIAGNHELGFDSEEDQSQRLEKDKGKGVEGGQRLLKDVTYLNDQSVEIEGIKFYGSSYHPLFGFPFYRRRADQMAVGWQKIPEDTDVLITHTPPLGYMDLFGTEQWGDRELLYAVERIKPKFHVFGHVHERFGAMSNNDTTFINAAQCSRNNSINSRPIVFYIPIPPKP